MQDRTVRPVLRHLERRVHPDNELVLVLEPHAFAVHDLVPALVDHRLAVLVQALRLDLHAVVAQLGIELGFDREEVFLEDMAQAESRRQRDGVITARDRNPGVVVRGQRSLQAAAEFKVVALFADGGTLGFVAGQAEIIGIDRGGFKPVAESHALLFGVDFVDGNLRRSRDRHRQDRRQRENQVKMFHSEAIVFDFQSTNL